MSGSLVGKAVRRITMMPNATTIQGIDRHNAARDILLTEARMEKLERDTPTCIRQKREYTKHNREYWEKTILETRKRPCLDEEHEQ